jgi:F-type H+-transporting ATPase subunit c
MKFVKCAALLLGLIFASAAPALAQDYKAASVAEQARIDYAKSTKHAFSDTRALGAGLVIIGAAMGIGMLAKAAVESMARQPEVAGQINTSMIIAAALIEGVTFFALIIIILQTTAY